MRLITDSEVYDFSVQQYENSQLGSVDQTVEIIDSGERILEALQGSGSCIEHESESLQQDYVEAFAENGNVHFYGLEGDGYARSVELPTSHGDALAVDAVKTGEEFDSETFRAGVNAVIKHADEMNHDIVLGGHEFFRYSWTEALDLTWDESSVNPAEEVFFDQAVSERELKVGYDEKPYSKGEQWDETEEFFLRRL